MPSDGPRSRLSLSRVDVRDIVWTSVKEVVVLLLLSLLWAALVLVGVVVLSVSTRVGPTARAFGLPFGLFAVGVGVGGLLRTWRLPPFR